MKLAAATAGESVPVSAVTWLTTRRAFALLACYFLLQALLRVLVSDSAELDESHQVLCAQSWQWGYGSDPPLYSWLQIVAFKLVGTNVLGLALLKNVLLFSAFVFTYFSAKAITRDERTSVLATLSLLLFPQITWESQRDLTHSVLATAIAAATFLVALRVARSKAPIDYCWLGVCLGLGTLSKYSYCLFALALALAALSMPGLRRAVLNKWFLLTLATWAVITTFHLQWVLSSPDLALVRSEQVLSNVDPRPVVARVLGVLSVFKCIVMLGAVITAAYLIAFWGTTSSPRDTTNAVDLLWIQRTLLVALIIALLVVLGSGIELKDRWFQPVTLLIAISAMLLIRNRLTLQAERRFTRVIGLVALLALTVLSAIPLTASITKRPTRLNAPYSTLAPQLVASVGRPGAVVAGNRLVGGNIKLRFPESSVISPEFHAVALDPKIPWLVVWDATKAKAVTPSQALSDLIMKSRGVNLADFPPVFVEADFKYTHAKRMRLACVPLPPSHVTQPADH